MSFSRFIGLFQQLKYILARLNSLFLPVKCKMRYNARQSDDDIVLFAHLATKEGSLYPRSKKTETASLVFVPSLAKNKAGKQVTCLARVVGFLLL